MYIKQGPRGKIANGKNRQRAKKKGEKDNNR